MEGKYWFFVPPNNCEHNNMEKKVEGVVILDYCPDCKLRFHPNKNEKET